MPGRHGDEGAGGEDSIRLEQGVWEVTACTFFAVFGGGGRYITCVCACVCHTCRHGLGVATRSSGQSQKDRQEDGTGDSGRDAYQINKLHKRHHQLSHHENSQPPGTIWPRLTGPRAQPAWPRTQTRARTSTVTAQIFTALAPRRMSAHGDVGAR